MSHADHVHIGQCLGRRRRIHPCRRVAVAAGLPAMNAPLMLGDNADGAVVFNGELDELQIAKVARPPGFLKFAALSQAGEKSAKLVVVGNDEQNEQAAGGEGADGAHTGRSVPGEDRRGNAAFGQHAREARAQRAGANDANAHGDVPSVQYFMPSAQWAARRAAA